MALGGVLGAAAVVMMCLGGLIPMATFVCPVLCMVLLCVVMGSCGKRIAFAWYSMVTLLSLLLCPDKEAAAVFAFLGFYPIIKPSIDTRRLSWLYKLILFNGIICLMYTLLMYLFGMDRLITEFQELGTALTVVTLILGNIVFFLLDKVLLRIQKVKHG